MRGFLFWRSLSILSWILSVLHLWQPVVGETFQACFSIQVVLAWIPKEVCRLLLRSEKPMVESLFASAFSDSTLDMFGQCVPDSDCIFGAGDWYQSLGLFEVISQLCNCFCLGLLQTVLNMQSGW